MDDQNQGTLNSGSVPTTSASDSSLGAIPLQDDPASSQPFQRTSSTNDDPNQRLLDIKSQALSQLAPLVKNLDQTPEEHFKTLMMMIQASDNKDLINEAYEVTNQITDEQAKAQALLDVVNEINYFTQR